MKNGDRIAVISTHHSNGFVRQDGTFLRDRVGANGKVYAFEYIWNGMTATAFYDKVRVEARTAEFRLH